MEEIKKNMTEETGTIHAESEIREFTRKTKDSRKKNLETGVQPWMWPAGFVLVVVAVIVCGILLCKDPVATVILVSVLEILLAGCLCESPVWLHGLVIVLNVVLGIIFHVAVFLILACVVYLAGILLLHVMAKEAYGV